MILYNTKSSEVDKGGIKMTVVKVIELLAESKESWEDATQEALTEASKRIRNIKSIYVEGFQIVIGDDGSHTYRVNTKVSFIVE